MMRNPSTGKIHPDYEDGIPIGYFDAASGRYVVYNHLHMVVKTHSVESSNKQRIVGFEVEPRSVGDPERNPLAFDPRLPKKFLADGAELDFTYSVETVNDPTTTWAARMEHYMKVGNERIHYAGITIALATIIALICIITQIL